MSTRSTTHFTDEGRTVAIIYRHSDGYPEGAGTDILRFLNECGKLNDPRFTDPSYLAAKYVVFLADMFNHSFQRNSKGVLKEVRNKSKLEFLSVGVLMEDPMDIEYRYVIDCGTLEDGKPKVTCYPVSCSYPENRWTQYDPVVIPEPEAVSS